MIRRHGRPARRPGNVVPLVCVMLVFLVGMVAFALDTGYIALNRTQMQVAVDAGVHAGTYKLATFEGQPLQDTAAKTELKAFVALNSSLSLLDSDIKVYRYNPYKAVGSQVSTAYSTTQPPNACEVTIRKDARANGQLSLFFGPVLGTNKADVRAKASSYLLPAQGILPNAPLIPYTMQVNYYYAAVGESRIGVDGNTILTQDNYKVNPTGTVSSGSDGIKEVVLFGGAKNAPGNFGSVDIGSASNGTPELDRQLLYGPTYADFHDKDFVSKLQPDGSLAPPVTLGGDPGISNGTKASWDQIVGKTRIIPLYDTVVGNGNNAQYNIVAFAAVVVTQVDMTGNPKQVWVQPTKIITANVTPGNPDTTVNQGIYSPPKLVIIPGT